MHEDLLSFLPKSDFTRREFVVTSLTAGFALATQPISAQTVITTDATGLLAGEVKITTKDGDIPAYRALPEKGKSFPVVLVVQEIFGVHEHIKDLCRRLAKVGYLAIAPEMYARQGDVSSIQDVQQIIQKVVSKVPDAQVMSDLDAAVAWAGKNKGETSKLAITGFCWGGRVVWLYAAHNPNLKAGAAWYGRLVGQSSELTPKNPIDVVAQIKAPVLGLYGGVDGGEEQVRNHSLSGHATWFQCRLSSQLSRGAGKGRVGQDACVVQEERCGLVRCLDDFEATGTVQGA